jgi:HD-like signal output (HDOD) protein/GGDEF domain-containing protein
MSDPAICVENLAAKAQRLCSLPSVAMRVLELTNNPQVDTRALKECIENDPALTCKILRVVNSSLFGLSSEVLDLNQALALLGSKPLKLLVLGFSLPADLFAGMSGEMLGRYWRRTLTKAVAARELSETLAKLSGDEAFIAGLLQDLGMLVCLQEMGDPFVRFLEKVTAAGRDVLAMETEALGFDHTRLTSRLLAQWGLPEALVSAVCWQPHDQPLPGPASPLAQVLQLAELLCRLVVDGHSAALVDLLELGRRYCGLSDLQLEQLVARLEERVGALADVLSLNLPAGLNYQDVLAQAQGQLAEVAAGTAEDILVGSSRPLLPQPIEPALLGEVQAISRSLHEPAGPLRQHRPRGPDRRKPAEAESPPEDCETGIRPADLPSCVDMAAAACRQSRCALSLLLVEINHLDRLQNARGTRGVALVRRLVAALCRRLDYPDMTCLDWGESGYALVLPRCDRRQAVQLGNQLIGDVCRLASVRADSIHPTFGISVGAATVTLPPKNFLYNDLIESANRCLYGSRASGGVIKSIEL